MSTLGMQTNFVLRHAFANGHDCLCIAASQMVLIGFHEAVMVNACLIYVPLSGPYWALNPTMHLSYLY